jgi:hypothetical protein
VWLILQYCWQSLLWYNIGSMTLPWGTSTLTGEGSVYSVSVSAMRIGSEYKKIIQSEQQSLTCIRVEYVILCGTAEKCLRML